MTSRISALIPLLVITLVCVGAVEGGYTIFEYFIRQQPVEAVVPPAIPLPEDSAGSMVPGAKRDYNIILTRNLFGPFGSKEPAKPAPPPDITANLGKTELGIVLVGTISDSEGTHRAIILDKKTSKQELYKAGDVVHGAHIKDILRGKVILDVNGKDSLLDISEAATVRKAAKPTVTEKPPPKMTQEPAVSSGAAEETPQAVEQPPEISPENNAPPPIQEGEPPAREIVRPRIIRPSRPSGGG